MDFGELPPEISSARMYSGPGPEPMLAAAAAWDRLAHELSSSAAACRSVVAGLATDGWRGPSSTLMTAAAGRHIRWLHNTAAQAEQTAVQAKSAATAYQTARATMVPPPLIEANRAELRSLVATNFFGQNSPAIAATEADYERMWAQDVATMRSYAAASSSTTSQLTPFAGPPSVVSHAPASTGQPLVAIPAQAVDSASALTMLLNVPSLTSAGASISSSTFSGIAIPTTNHALAVNAERDAALGIGPFLAGSAAPLPAAGLTGAAAPTVSAAMGRASLAGALSVPQGWAATASTPATAAAAPAAGAAVSSTPAALPPGVFGESMLGTLAGRGVRNAAAKARRPGVIPRSPAAG